MHMHIYLREHMWVAVLHTYTHMHMIVGPMARLNPTRFIKSVKVWQIFLPPVT